MHRVGCFQSFPDCFNFHFNNFDAPVLSTDPKEEDLAKAGIDALEDLIKEIGATSNVSGSGLIEAMLEGFADATILGGFYKELTRDDVIQILKNK